jgi:acylpyruvate hydrolase
MRLERGDVILTGTPAGVGPLRPGQTISAGLSLDAGPKAKDLVSMKFAAALRKRAA